MADSKQNKTCNPEIVFTKYSSYSVVDVEKIIDSTGKQIRTAPVISLCRCGASKRKPHCDGTHSKIGFVGEKEEGRLPDKVKDYVGKDITIHDNRGVCSHDESCVNGLPNVFKKGGRPWIDPNGASVGEIITVIERCPSGALSYSIGNRLCKDLAREPMIKIAKNGPLQIQGGISIRDDIPSKPESKEHYTLCRCGKSKNKPFCDGAHWDGFNDEE